MCGAPPSARASMATTLSCPTQSTTSTTATAATAAITSSASPTAMSTTNPAGTRPATTGASRLCFLHTRHHSLSSICFFQRGITRLQEALLASKRHYSLLSPTAPSTPRPTASQTRARPRARHRLVLQAPAPLIVATKLERTFHRCQCRLKRRLGGAGVQVFRKYRCGTMQPSKLCSELVYRTIEPLNACLLWCTCRPARRTGDDDGHASSGRMLNLASALVCGPWCRYADTSPRGDLRGEWMRKYYQYTSAVPRSGRSGRVPHEPPPASIYAGFIFSVATTR